MCVFYIVKINPALMVQWLGLGAFTAMAPGSISGQGIKILKTVWLKEKRIKISPVCHLGLEIW